MKPYLKTVETIVETDNIVDIDTGEIIDISINERKRTVLVNTEKEFVQLYYSLNGILDNTTLAETRLLIHLSMMCDGENRIALPLIIKEEISKLSSLHVQTINNCLSSLTKRGILIRIATGFYRINPRYIWKKSQADRDKILKYVLEVECPNC